MRIALDVTPITAGSTGVARYARELHVSLVEAGVDVVTYAIGRGPHPAPEGTHHLRVPLRAVQRMWQVVGRPRVEDLVGPVDLVHCLDLLPTPSRAPCVMTAHDLVALELPALHSPRQVETQRRQLAAFGRADLVLADSRATAAALVQRGVPADRVTVVPLGLSDPGPITSHDRGPYLLAVGELAARKNLPVLIEAFRAARLPEQVELLLVGPEGFGAEGTTSLLGGRVRALGRVDDATLAGLYAGATALCFPSLAEGFGLPVLEAMRAGTPVIASDLDVLREVAGDAAVYVAASDVRAWSAALERVVDDQDLRAKLARAGIAASEGRTWAVTAAATVAAYEKVLSCG
jgi:glycosyltransferase involved in cell wall biosynthesis